MVFYFNAPFFYHDDAEWRTSLPYSAVYATVKITLFSAKEATKNFEHVDTSFANIRYSKGSIILSWVPALIGF